METRERRGPQRHKPLKARSMTACLFYANGTGRVNDHGIRCQLTTYPVCDPDTCPWFLSQEMSDASYERARQIWKKNHGVDDYYARGFGPKRRMIPRPE